MRAFVLLLLLVAAGADASLGPTITRLDPEGRRASFEELLVDMATDEDYARRVLDAADRGVASVTDSLIAFVSMTEPEARALMPTLDVARDKGEAEVPGAPRWHAVQWQGLHLLHAIAPDPDVARDLRFRRELQDDLETADAGSPAVVRGVVGLARVWWADRGDDPSLTHDRSRILDVEPWLARLDLPSGHAEAWSAPHMLADLDADPILHVRIARRLDPDHHAHLAAELVRALRSMPEDFVEQGIERRRWDAARGRTFGSNATELWRIALELLERCTGRPFSGPDDDRRRLAALGWWEGAQFQARYWRDPHETPSLARFLERGLFRPDGTTPRRAAEWAREIYLERGIRDVVLDRLDARHEAAVGELVALLPMPREQAHAAGFAQAYRSDVVDQPGVTRRVAIDWERAREFLRRMLTRLTGVDEPAGSDVLSAGAQAAFWMDWWAANRADPRWSREGFEVADPPPAPEKPRFETRRGRVD